MTVDDWVFEALDRAGGRGADVREVQRWIDERHGEELAVDTIDAALADLVAAGRAETRGGGRYAVVRSGGGADALKKLFGE
ncbi:MAG: hypothetical protein RI554_02910 [Trueperaceae bacterium]|nr:hypothetical protein [Trueperaceae bacterium]